MTAVLPPSIAGVRDLVDPAMRAAVDRLEPSLREVAAYHMGWHDAEGRPTQASGKALRPALALLSARAAGAPAGAGVPGAVAVELIHAFSLLHDDVMDRDRTRRHRPAAWTVYGTASAILTGDALLGLAMELLLEQGTTGGTRAAGAVSDAVRELITGQAMDLRFERRDDVALDECITMAAGKTGALLACSCSVGALLADAPPRSADALAGFGGHLGLAFQLVDDLLGIWGSPEVTGKPVLSDLRSRKKSLPVVAALRAGGPEEGAAGGALAELLGRPGRLTEEELHRAAALVEEAGGRSWARERARVEMDAAAGRLDEVADLPPDARSELLDIAHFVVDRDM